LASAEQFEVSDRPVFSHGIVMKALSPMVRALALCGLIGSLSGCSELSARRHAREGNRLFRDGDFAAAVREYEQSEELYAGIAAVALNKGLACRQLMIPGAKTAANERATDCALKSFSRLKELQRDDPRAEQLYLQTLFDADRFQALEARYRKQVAAKPDDLAAVNALIQVYSRWNRWRDALHWTRQRATLQASDAEAQYGAGVFIYNLLFQKGGGTDKSSFDPRPLAKDPKPPPVFAPGDIIGSERVALADEGIKYLEKALALRPKYPEALAYLSLTNRQKSFAFFDDPDEWQKIVDTAEGWRRRASQPQVVAPPKVP
jgi:tetratricopeptide (TPR) repeat protein